MNFQPELAHKVMNGRKTVTRRLVSSNPRSPWWRERCGYVIGRDYAICPGRSKHAIGRAILTNLSREQLGHLTPSEAMQEGFPSVAAFEKAWASINGSYDPDALVWRVALTPMAGGTP